MYCERHVIDVARLLSGLVLDIDSRLEPAIEEPRLFSSIRNGSDEIIVIFRVSNFDSRNWISLEKLPFYARSC